MQDLENYYQVQQSMPLVTVPEWVVSNEYDLLNDRFVEGSRGRGCNEVDLWGDSFILAPVGPRGSGKTTLSSALAIKSKWLWPELRVISNYPMKWAIKDGKGSSVVHLSEPLDLVKMVNIMGNQRIGEGNLSKKAKVRAQHKLKVRGPLAGARYNKSHKGGKYGQGNN